MTRQEWLAQRVGYGNLDAAWWFLGFEETLPISTNIDELRARLEGAAVEGLQELSARLPQSSTFAPFLKDPPELHPEWQSLALSMLAATHQPFGARHIGSYQAHELGSPGGDTLLAWIWPLPRRRGVWPYAQLDANLSSESAYRERYLADRIALFKELLTARNPEVVVVYGPETWPIVKQLLSGVAWTPMDLPMAKGRCQSTMITGKQTLVALVPSPLDKSFRPETWHALGIRIAQLAAYEEPGNKLTANRLVRAVRSLGESAKSYIVSSSDIMRWCESQQPPLEYGRGERNDVFWQIELNEARGRHRLMKLKDGSSQTAANYFALKEHEPHVLLEGARRGLWLVPWNADARNSQLGGIGNWEWAESTKLVG